MAMNRKHAQSSLEDLVRRHGVPPQPKVEVLASEVRSCFVPVYPRPQKEPDGLLGGIVVIWEFCLQLGDVQEFHDFLRKQEPLIAGSVSGLAKGVNYLGTYMQYAPGNPSYRTIWAYESLEVMGRAWTQALKKKDPKLYNAVRQLRAFWLRDPHRTEARWVPGRYYFDPAVDSGDGFAKLTLEAFKLNPARRS
jgi:hypothetical protein